MVYRFKGVEAKQHGRRVLVGVIPARDLAEMYEKKILKVDVYSPSNPDGYQRSLSQTRARKFGRFIKDMKEGISPTSVLIYSRSADGGIREIEPGLYEITDSPTQSQLYITDGQHRTFGISEAFREGWLREDSNYDVPVTMLFWDSEHSPADQRLEEAGQFHTINTQQKRMRTDLAHQYLFKRREAGQGPIGGNTQLPLTLKKKDYVPYEIFVARRLRTDMDSPWKDLILPPNAVGDAPITEGSLTDSLRPIMDYCSEADLTMEEAVELLKNFWCAVFSLCPDAKANPTNYVLMKTAGVYSLHIVLPILMARKRNLGNVASKDQFEQVLRSVGDCFTDNFWDSANGEAASLGTSKKSFQELAEHIVSEIP